MQGSNAIAAKKKKKVHVSNQVKLDANNPIPFENGQAAFSFVNQVSYLPFLPPNDDFANDLLQARLLSNTNNSCIRTKKDYCAGDGFRDSGGATLNKSLINWLATLNLRNESATECNKKIFEDFFTYGNVPIELVRFTVAGTKKFFVYPHSFLEWRLGKPDDDDNVNYAVQSKLFLRNGYITSDIVKKSKKLPIYNPLRTEKENWLKDKEKGVERTLIWYKNSTTGFQHYGLPSNISSLIYQLLEYKGARYNLDNFDNSMVIAALLALKGNLSQTEADRIGRDLIKTYTGDGRRGRTMVVASEEGIDSSSYHKMETKTDGSFNESDSKWEQKIILANEWDAILAGLISPSTLGKGAGFLTKILEIKFNSVIKPAQRALFDNVWKYIFEAANSWLNLGLDQYNLEFNNSIDISGLTDVDITPAVQVNEVRKAKNLAEDPKRNGEYMKPAGSNKKGGDDVQD